MPDSTQRDAEPHFLLDADLVGSRNYLRAGIGSVLVNLAAFTLIGWLWSKDGSPQERPTDLVAELRHATRIVAPVHISQPPNAHSGVTKKVNLQDLMERSKATPPPPPMPKRFVAPKLQQPPPRPLPAPAAPPPPPQLEATTRAVTPPPGVNTPAPPPRIQAEEPKLAFETPGQSSGGPRTTTLARILPPSHSLQDAVHSAARSANQGGPDIGEMEVQISPPQIPGLGSPESPTRLKSTIAPQILSDTHGVDFRPYLIRVLTAIKKNWASVVPESARLGRQGVTTLQFAIARDGTVPRLVISVASGTEALDRAAVAGVSASNPFPPLPSEYPGGDLRLQLVFTYNMPKQ